MYNTIVREKKIFSTKRDAERTAEVLGYDDEDGWDYRVRSLKDGGFVISIHDEDGEFVEYWS